MNIVRITLPVEGLGCGGGGALQIERAIAHMRGIRRAYVNPATVMAYLEYEPEGFDLKRVFTVVEQLGFRLGSPTQR